MAFGDQHDNRYSGSRLNAALIARYIREPSQSTGIGWIQLRLSEQAQHGLATVYAVLTSSPRLQCNMYDLSDLEPGAEV